MCLYKYFFFLLQDIEDLENKPVNTISYTVNSENGCVTLSEAHFAELQRTIQTLKAQLEQRELACFLAKQVSRCDHCIVYNILFFYLARYILIKRFKLMH